MSVVSGKISINEDLDTEARVFSACFIKTFEKNGNKVFSTREIQEVAQCTMKKLEQMFRKNPPKAQ